MMMKSWETLSTQLMETGRAIAAADPAYWEGAAAEAFRDALNSRVQDCNEAGRLAHEVALAFLHHAQAVAT